MNGPIIRAVSPVISLSVAARPRRPAGTEAEPCESPVAQAVRPCGNEDAPIRLQRTELARPIEVTDAAAASTSLSKSQTGASSRGKAVSLQLPSVTEATVSCQRLSACSSQVKPKGRSPPEDKCSTSAHPFTGFLNGWFIARCGHTEIQQVQVQGDIRHRNQEPASLLRQAIATRPSNPI